MFCDYIERSVIYTINKAYEKNAFHTMNEALYTTLTIKAHDFSNEFVVQTDASEHGTGAMLTQLNNDGEGEPIAFISRQLLHREHHWRAIEK